MLDRDNDNTDQRQSRAPSVKSMSDEALMDLVQAPPSVEARNEAIHEIFDRYRLRLERFVRATLREVNHMEVEDMVSRIFIRMYEKRERFDPELQFAPWLFTIAFRMCMSALKRSARAPAQVDMENIDIADDDESMIDRMERVEQIFAVRAALDKLDLEPEVRQTFELVLDGRLSRAEIAAQLGIPIGTVHSRYFQTLRKLRAVTSLRVVMGRVQENQDDQDDHE